METKTTWEYRKQFLNLLKKELNPTLAVESFENLKQNYSYYDLAKTTGDLEKALYDNVYNEIVKIESHLPKTYSYQDYLTDLILRDYAREYINRVHPDVMKLTSLTEANDRLTDLRLLDYCKEISYTHRKILQDIFDRHMIKIEITSIKPKVSYTLTEGLTGNSFDIDPNGILSFAIGQSNNLFDFTKVANASRIGPKFVYDEEIWTNYALSLNEEITRINNLFNTLFNKSEEGFDYSAYDEFADIAFYKKSLDSYRDFAEGYSFVENINEKKI